MSTLAEIEDAVEKLPAAQLKALFQFIAERVNGADAPIEDPVVALIGAYHSGNPSIGEDAEDILYGRDGNE